jgi:two-component system sensor histidine kinase KdpD
VTGALTSDDRRVLDSFTAQFELALTSRQLRKEAAQSAALAKANELRTTLLNAVSHDLRTPLTTIKTTASSLQDPAVSVDSEVRDELLGTIVGEADRLNEMVANLVDLGRIEADVVEIQATPVHLVDVVSSAVRTTTNGHRTVQIDLSETLPPVAGDAVLLERVIANLLANASRYSSPGTAISVHAVDRGHAVELRVVDHGQGIPTGSRQRVFEPFQRLDGAPEAEGVGLGLAVARGFIEAMHGTLEVDETPGGGTTMVATLPAANHEEATDAQAPLG